MCLDVLRAFAREPRTREALAVLLSGAKGRDARYDRFVDDLLTQLADPDDGELRARDLTQKIALAVQAAVLIGHGPDTTAQAFLASRLASGAPASFGTLPRGLNATALIERVFIR
jgi:putative acyl-CoA dehydrogenase